MHEDVPGGAEIPKRADTADDTTESRVAEPSPPNGDKDSPRDGKVAARSGGADGAKTKSRRRSSGPPGTSRPKRSPAKLPRGTSASASETMPTPARAVEVPDLQQELLPHEREMLGDLVAVISEHAEEAVDPVDMSKVTDAFVFACERHADQRRKSGEQFITHPTGVAKICAGMRLDTETICAALLHDTVEDTSASLDDVNARFGEDIGQLVDGVTKLSGITFQSRDEHQAENYRKMMVAMASDIRVILIKLADRLHNMRTLSALPKQKQIDKAKETLDIYAPLAHRLGIHSIKWELEDLAFSTLHPRKHSEIKVLVNQQRQERDRYVERAGGYLKQELEAVGIDSSVSGRAKHFYSIYSKMTKKGREFNEIYDLTAMRVIVDSVKDCYGAIGVIHSLWKPLPGRFKDYIAMPRFNLYQALHTTVIGPEGRPLEIQIRTRQMHYTAEYGVAAHWIYKGGTRSAGRQGRRQGIAPRARRRGAGGPRSRGPGLGGAVRSRRRSCRRRCEAGVAEAPARLAAGAPRSPRVHGDAQDRPLRG